MATWSASSRRSPAGVDFGFWRSDCMAEYQVIGKPVPRVDAIDKVTGAARYAADMNLPGMLWGKFVRSPYPHARIKRIDTSKAEALPGVRVVITQRSLGA